MTFFGLLAFASIMTLIGKWTRFFAFKIIAGLVWVVSAIYVVVNPIAGTAKGDAVDSAIIAVLAAISIGCFVYAFGDESERTEYSKGGQVAVLKRMFALRKPNNNNHQETAGEYRERMQAARARGRGSVTRR